MDKLESYDEADADREFIDKEATKAKFRLLGPLSKVYNIIVYIWSLGGHVDHFRKLVGRIILIDNYIR